MHFIKMNKHIDASEKKIDEGKTTFHDATAKIKS